MLVASLYVLWNWASEADDYIDRCADDLNPSYISDELLRLAACGNTNED